MRDLATLRCEEKACGYSYHTRKNKKTTTERLKRKKFCKKCRKHTVFTETK